jgi:hypothetical protein
MSRAVEALKSLLILRRSPEPEPEQVAAHTPSPTADVNDDELTPEMKRKLEEFKKGLLVGISTFPCSCHCTYFD